MNISDSTQLWEHTSDAMALSDASGIVLAADPAYYRLYGYRPAEFNAIHERQPGFRGSLVIRADDGATVALNLWESERDAMAGLEVLRPAVQRLLEPLLREPAVLVVAGPVEDKTLRPA